MTPPPGSRSPTRATSVLPPTSRTATDGVPRITPFNAISAVGKGAGVACGLLAAVLLFELLDLGRFDGDFGDIRGEVRAALRQHGFAGRDGAGAFDGIVPFGLRGFDDPNAEYRPRH